MKAKLLLLGAAALTLGGCATYTGGTDDDYGTVYGSDASYVDPHRTDMGRGTPLGPPTHFGPTGMIIPVYKEGSPNGTDMGGTRPDIIFYR